MVTITINGRKDGTLFHVKKHLEKGWKTPQWRVRPRRGRRFGGKFRLRLIKGEENHQAEVSNFQKKTALKRIVKTLFAAFCLSIFPIYSPLNDR